MVSGLTGEGSRAAINPVVETAWRDGSEFDDGGISVHQYSDETVWFATQHQKTPLVEGPLKQIAGIHVRTRLVDTDALGTFTGEIERPGDALETVVAKARLALPDETAFGMASEGSFSPHPMLPFVPVGIELLAFVDARRDVVLVERSAVTPTNWSHVDLPADGPLVVENVWLAQIGFGDHRVCVVGLDETQKIWGVPAKGINQAPLLESAITELAQVPQVRTVRLMTDMRAHTNPTRQAAIAELAIGLAIRLTRGCPSCSQAGWARIGAQRGLPCSWCSTPTDRAALWIFGCSSCGFTLNRPSPGPSNADPGECSACNP